MSLNYGESWYEKPFYYDDVINSFKNDNPNLNVTKSGKDTINGAISFGNSYFRITNEFGLYVKNLIDEFEYSN